MLPATASTVQEPVPLGAEPVAVSANEDGVPGVTVKEEGEATIPVPRFFIVTETGPLKPFNGVTETLMVCGGPLRTSVAGDGESETEMPGGLTVIFALPDIVVDSEEVAVIVTAMFAPRPLAGVNTPELLIVPALEGLADQETVEL
jgi:hypothetical protein